MKWPGTVQAVLLGEATANKGLESTRDAQRGRWTVRTPLGRAAFGWQRKLPQTGLL